MTQKNKHIKIILLYLQSKLQTKILYMKSLLRKNHKANIAILSFVLLAIGLASCTNEEICYKSAQVEISVEALTLQECNNASAQISSILNYSTRAAGEGLTEEEAQFVLKPLTTNGKSLQKQFLRQKDLLGLTPEETKSVENMTEGQLTEMAFAFNTFYNNASSTQSVSSNDIVDCLMHATGITDVADLIREGFGITGFKNYYTGTKMLISARSAKQFLKAFAKRTAGWVGVAWMVYDFGDCISSKQKKK